MQIVELRRMVNSVAVNHKRRWIDRCRNKTDIQNAAVEGIGNGTASIDGRCCEYLNSRTIDIEFLADAKQWQTADTVRLVNAKSTCAYLRIIDFHPSLQDRSTSLKPCDWDVPLPWIASRRWVNYKNWQDKTHLFERIIQILQMFIIGVNHHIKLRCKFEQIVVSVSHPLVIRVWGFKLKSIVSTF